MPKDILQAIGHILATKNSPIPKNQGVMLQLIMQGNIKLWHGDKIGFQSVVNYH